MNTIKDLLVSDPANILAILYENTRPSSTTSGCFSFASSVRVKKSRLPAGGVNWPENRSASRSRVNAAMGCVGWKSLMRMGFLEKR